MQSKVFKINQFNKWGIILFGVVSIIISVIIIFNFVNRYQAQGISSFLTGFLMGLVFLAFGVILIARVSKLKIELLEDRIKVYGVFKNKEFLLNDIEGCKLNLLHNKILLYHKSKKLFSTIELIYENKVEIKNWLREKYPTEFLTKVEIENISAQNEFWNNPKYGIDIEQRRQKLEQAKWRAVFFGRIFFYSFAICIFAPSSFLAANITIIFLSSILILFTMFFRDWIKIFNQFPSFIFFFPSIVYSLIFMVFRAYICWDILLLSRFWVILSLATFLLWLIILKFDKPTSKFWPTHILIISLLSLPAYGFLLHLNSLVETKPIEVYEVSLIKKDHSIAQNKFDQVEITLEPWHYNPNTSQLYIDKDFYNNYIAVGKINITVHHGLLGIIWLSYNGQFDVWGKFKFIFRN